MGTFSLFFEIGAISGGELTQVDALVDTGATYTVLSREVLVRLGIQVIDTVSFELADDRIVEYDVGEAVSAWMDGSGPLWWLSGPPVRDLFWAQPLYSYSTSP